MTHHTGHYGILQIGPMVDYAARLLVHIHDAAKYITFPFVYTDYIYTDYTYTERC